MAAPSDEAAYFSASPTTPEGTPHRLKLGLALAGGGFRAALFHLGVLRRLAELDVLRRVEVLSTVSGGSVVGGLYSLLVRRDALRGGARTRGDYLAIVHELERRLIAGIQKNLRNRLFQNPLDLFRAMVRPYSLANRMGRLYEGYLFREVVAEIRALEGGAAPRRPGAYPLRWLRPPGLNGAEGVAEVEGLEDYNAAQATRKDGAAVLHHVINATAVNTGGRFGLSSAEVGGWYLGYVRYREVGEVTSRITLLRALREGEPAPPDLADAAPVARWAASGGVQAPESPGRWREVFELDCVDALLRADFGLLRRAKLPAWYLTRGRSRTTPLLGGTPGTLEAQFLAALQEVDADLARAYRGSTADVRRAAEAFVVETYYLRSAMVFARDVEEHLDRLTVGDAVAASAAFPPVFSPFTKEGIYANAHVGRLGLTDGGVFDNAGLIALRDEGCTVIIASDTGGPPPHSRNASTNRLSLVARVASIATSDLGVIQRALLRERRRATRAVEGDLEGRGPGDPLHDYYHAHGLRGLAYFHTASGLTGTPPPGLDPSILPDAGSLSALRTDLDAFGDVETAALMNRGYALADAYVREHLRAQEEAWRVEVPWDALPFELPYAPQDPEAFRQRQAEALDVGGGRFFRALRHGLPLAWAATLAVGLGLAALAWRYGDAAARYLVEPHPWTYWGLDTLRALWRGLGLPVLGAGAIVALLLLLVLAGVVAGGVRPPGALRQRAARSNAFGWARKWALWGGLYLALFLVPYALLALVALALGLGLYAFINHFCYQRPLLAAMRLPDAPWHRQAPPSPARAPRADPRFGGAPPAPAPLA